MRRTGSWKALSAALRSSRWQPTSCGFTTPSAGRPPGLRALRPIRLPLASSGASLKDVELILDRCGFEPVTAVAGDPLMVGEHAVSYGRRYRGPATGRDRGPSDRLRYAGPGPPAGSGARSRRRSTDSPGRRSRPAETARIRPMRPQRAPGKAPRNDRRTRDDDHLRHRPRHDLLLDSLL